MDGKASITVLLTCVGLLLLPGVAQATLYNLDVSGVPGKTSGSYHVVIDDINNTQFQIVSVHANSGAQTPSVDVFRVRIYFYSGINGTGTNLGGLGVTPSGDSGGTNPAETNWGSGVVVTNAGSNVHFQNFGQYLNPNFHTGLNNIQANGSNTFGQLGWFTVPSSPGVESFIIQLNDGTPFIGTVNVPEASSLALLAAGLIPLGLTIRRRSARSQALLRKGPS